MKGYVESPPLNDCAHCEVERDLAAVLRLQRLLAAISSRLVTHPAGRVDEAIEQTQQLICETLGLDRSTLWQTTDGGTDMALTHFWQRPDGVPLRRNITTSGNLPWAENMVERAQAFHFSNLAELPPEAAHDAETLRLHGTKSNATFPLVADCKVFGAIAFAMTAMERTWTEHEISSLELVAQIFGHVISRQRAEERTKQLREEIQSSARAAELGEIAASLAHEINQPLTTILGNAQAARRFITQGNAAPEEILAILDDIIRDDKRAADVIRSLRAILADTPMPREPLSLNELVSDVCGFLHQELAEAQVELQLHLTPKLPAVQVARVEIQQIIHNLLLNAAHAMGNKPREQRQILIHTEVCGPMVNLRVRDWGGGIPPGHIDRIFEPFHTTRSSGLGLGMGLAICRRIAEAHGGSIHASNHPSSGAEFSLSLPPHH